MKFIRSLFVVIIIVERKKRRRGRDGLVFFFLSLDRVKEDNNNIQYVCFFKK